ncbi:cerebellar degeneration-related protein 2-like isoform X2 [Paramacrobiotus metropolitanus]|uniref:cerebellar degeneration-related protein 2-like isoform X2 n=1 Tax=Paramacrobiotus metropolitanus TaxID=2943436 RepID=UPI002445BE39|nr:cerebellar degeneration-related protein 2-like isoform X2 [Paramacrobiotus metropolitanus]
MMKNCANKSASSLSPTVRTPGAGTAMNSLQSDGEEEISSDPATLSAASLSSHLNNSHHLFHHHEWTYEIDLQLAAELGKTLLQRNKELETDLTTYQDLADDQALEIDFLTKQVHLLRDESSTRLAACEMLESQLQELKRSEGNLQELRNLDYMRITRLQDTVEVLQSRCEELQTQITEMKRKNWEDKFASNTSSHTATTGSGGMTRSISHGEALKTASKSHPNDSDDDDSELGPEMHILKEKIKVLQRQVTDERKQRELLQDQVVHVVADNTSLWQQLDHVTKEAASWREKLEHLTNKYADEIAAFNEQRGNDRQGVAAGNHDDTDISEDFSSLSSCSAPAPQVSILDEIADSLRDRFLDDFRREQEELDHEKESQDDKDHHLKSKTTQTDTGLIIDYLSDPTQGRFQRGPPEYKKLFKEIFDIIKKSQEEDLARAAQAKRSQKPKKHVVYYYNQF